MRPFPTRSCDHGDAVRVFGLSCALLFVPAVCGAQTGGGFLFGAGHQPSQVWAGLHVQVEPLPLLRFRIDVLGGTGSELSVSSDAVALLVIPVRPDAWTIHVGAGSGAVRTTALSSSGSRPYTGGGLLAAVGATFGRIFVEARIPFGGVDQPSPRLVVGYVFPKPPR